MMTAVVAVMMTLGASAQTSLVGRTYHNPDIMAAQFRDWDKELANVEAKAIAKKEKERGRKLTAEERKNMEGELTELKRKYRTIKEGTKMAMTVTFKNDKTMSVKEKANISDDVLKEAGYGWAKRKMLKAAMAVMPAEDRPYIVKGNMVIITDENVKDTFRLSADGKQLSGKDGDLKYTLTRTK
jgi:hypothetical protein